MSPEDLERRLGACREIAREAGAIARRHFEDVASLTVETKGVQDLVSVADREVEAAIKARIGALFPDDRSIGEESGGSGGDAVWVIDPIDGTTNFLRGIPHYAISIGFVAGGEAVLGVIYDPSMDHLYAARRGGGATCNGRPIRVRETHSLDHAVLSFGFSHQSPVEDFAARTRAVLEHKAEFRRLGSAALGLAYVAAGHLDGFWQKYLHSWDVVAGIALIHEAGGRTNDFLAGDGLLAGNVMLAATPALYDPLAELFGVPA